ncbi:Na/Pi cotransporter family protein [Cytobacillus kochii]|uniref:Na/Pi cotransporter family protein n=2 Tax=Bacillaceae TaxID=186817 RepID=UPI001CD52760|nr:Na/Pi cotransporter family protein [Cytobacillus kochii]MCA1025470.1 Na/Pi cotransporter family protein [Cytobacillus kochii]MCM3320573.1 Na/Pi cotransporter family protein [Cytobacillus kochii]MCM3344593.1 Na/Pi cotransporter family protein [Cytobacillus kochii]MDM5208482.1 Na/Pi cotransporter family protein [Cytobacillus kochii]
MELDIQKMIFEFVGGLGIFLLGIKTMGDGLQKSAGDRLRDILDKFTTNPLMGVLAGMLVTMLIQSSSATTVLTVGLVSAGFMNLRQAIGVIMGANIGTTFTAFIIGLDIGEYALPILAIGVLCLVFFKNNRMQNIGSIIFGFGALFYGLELMGGGMKPLSNLQSFHDLTVSMSEIPVLGVLVGTVLTVIVQSSSATIGILQGLFSEGLISLDAALPVLFGDNIGTTITAILASLGATVAAKRAALVHVTFNLIGATIFLILLHPFTLLVEMFQANLGLNPELTIAFAHGTFNITNTLIQLPFVAVLAYIVTKLIPGEDTVIEQKAKHLDAVFIQQSPSIALGQAKEEVLRMGQFAVEGLNETRSFLIDGSPKHGEKAYQIESAINNLDRQITDYLIQLSRSSLSNNESSEHTVLMDTIRDIERMGDHFENIVELMDYKKANKVSITESAMKDLDDMFQLTISTVSEALEALDHNDKEAAQHVVQKEDQIDKMERKLRKQHIIRLSEGVCSGQAGIVYVDILSNLERIGDHAVNIAEAVLGED